MTINFFCTYLNRSGYFTLSVKNVRWYVGWWGVNVRETRGIYTPKASRRGLRPPGKPVYCQCAVTAAEAGFTCWPCGRLQRARGGLWRDDVRGPCGHLLSPFSHEIRACSLFCGSRAGMFFSSLYRSFLLFQFSDCKIRKSFPFHKIISFFSLLKSLKSCFYVFRHSR